MQFAEIDASWYAARIAQETEKLIGLSADKFEDSGEPYAMVVAVIRQKLIKLLVLKARIKHNR